MPLENNFSNKTPFREGRSFWESTKFPDNSDENPRNCDEATSNSRWLPYLDITPIRPNQISNNYNTYSNLCFKSNEISPQSNHQLDSFNAFINGTTLTNSDIDSLADRVQSLLLKSVQQANTNTKDITQKYQDELPFGFEYEPVLHNDKSNENVTIIAEPVQGSSFVKTNKEHSSKDNQKTSQMRNANSILLEANHILQRIHSLTSQSKPDYDTNQLERENMKQQLSSEEVFPARKEYKAIITENNEPPPPLVSSIINQTFNSHIFENKNFEKPIRTGKQQIKQTIKNNCVLNNCPSDNVDETHFMNQLERDTNELKRLNQELLRFELKYKKHRERRLNQRANLKLIKNKCKNIEVEPEQDKPKMNSCQLVNENNEQCRNGTDRHGDRFHVRFAHQPLNKKRVEGAMKTKFSMSMTKHDKTNNKGSTIDSDSNKLCSCCRRKIDIMDNQSHMPRKNLNKCVQTSIIVDDNNCLVDRFDKSPPIPSHNISKSVKRPKSCGYFISFCDNNSSIPAKLPDLDTRILNSQSKTNSNYQKKSGVLVFPTGSSTLQDAFERNCVKFKIRSLLRVRKIKDNELMRVETAEQRGQLIAQSFLMKKKLEEQQKQMGSSAQVKRPKLVHDTNCKQKFPRPIPIISRRVFTHREMRAQTEKVYRKLPEVRHQDILNQREDDAKRRRIMADMFKQRLKENAIRGKLNWPITSQAIFS